MRRIGAERGVVLLLVSLGLVALMGFLALALDMSLAMNDRRTAQNAADHAALSASYAKCTGGNPGSGVLVAS